MKKELSQFIEQMGLLWEGEGLPRIAGRIHAVTLLSKGPCSLDEIAEGLSVSKASVSNDARLLENLGFLERVGRPGDRKSYYQITDDSMERTLSTRVARLRVFQETIASGIDLPVDSGVRARLKLHDRAYRAVIGALEDALGQMKTTGNSSTKRSRRA
jgi:DNA-binding transcriptional regulator GbsR (MarR family)